MGDPTPRCCKFAIKGLRDILEGEQGLHYDPRDGLNVVLSGPAGSGKTLLALQMAVTGAIESGMNVVYLSKDTPPETVLYHLWNDFLLFGEAELPQPPGAPAAGWTLPPALAAVEKEEGAPDPAKNEAGRRDYVAWLGTRIETACTRTIPIAPGEDAARRPESVRFVLLDRLAEALARAGASASESRGLVASCLRAAEPVLAFGSFGWATMAPAQFDEEVWKGLLVTSLGKLCEPLNPVFDWLERRGRRWTRHFLLVLDSLPAKLLGDCLRAQAERPGTPSCATDVHRPVTLFVSECPDLPESLVASFPPDVQVKLAHRDDPHGSRTKTIQFLKVRFQRVRPEAFPFVIVDRHCWKAGECHALNDLELSMASARKKRGGKRDDPQAFEFRTPGITILPSVVDAATCREVVPPRPQMPIVFGVAEIDGLTKKKRLAGGGCTLLVTENRCNSTALGLHYLLGQIASAAPDPPSAADGESLIPRSVLYIAVDEDLPGVLHDIWRLPTLRRAIWDGKGDPGEAWERVEKRAQQEVRADGNHGPRGAGARRQEERRGLHRLYKIPLLHWPCENHDRGHGAYLYVLIPDLVWCSQEEILERVTEILKYGRHKSPGNPCRVRGGRHYRAEREGAYRACLTVDRVLINRVSRIQTRWPLIDDTDLFVSNLAQLCRLRRIELMIIDDTATQSPTSGNISSHWISIAQNILRLKRVPFHGSEAVALELIRSHGRSPTTQRPQELRAETVPPPPENSRAAEGHATRTDQDREPAGFREWKLTLEDSFRGYTGLFTGKPERCSISVDLPYDQRHTPLYRDMMDTKRNLEALMEGIRVTVAGPEERPGVNSALSNLAYVTHDTCHVASIDEVWMHRLIGDAGQPSGLAVLSPPEVERALPAHVLRRIAQEHPGAPCDHWTIKKQYVTEAMTLSCLKAERPEAVYALPFRHNWGVLAVSIPRRDALERLVRRILGYFTRGAELPGATPDAGAIEQWVGERLRALACVLLDNEDLYEGLKDREIRDAAARMRNLLWGRATGQRLAVSWETLAFFKREVWDSVVASAECQAILRAGKRTEPQEPEEAELFAELRKWFDPDTRLDFFDFDKATSESVVSFFLELLLTHTAWTDLFERDAGPGRTAEDYSTAFLLKLKTGDATKVGLVKTLVLLHSLLSERQRREIAYGPVRREPSPAARDAAKGQSEADGPRPEPLTGRTERCPAAYALVSREWLSTVPDVGVYTDLRDRIERRPLPAAGDDLEGNRLLRLIACRDPASAEPLSDFERGLVGECRRHGVTLSGTWYLGALSGGNIELATDVIRELVSEYHERDRMNALSAAPVTREFYQYPKRGRRGRHPDLPYARLLSYVYERRSDGAFPRGIPTFPFCRTRIREYTTISLELATLVRRAMQLPSETTLEGCVGDLVTATLANIKAINANNRARRGQRARATAD